MAEAKIGISCDDPKQVERWNTRPAPAATDTGLVTYRVEAQENTYYENGHNHSEGWDVAVIEDPEGDYVTRSQAEELLAAERHELVMLKADFNDINAERQRWKDRAEKAEADNAALTARNKELNANTDTLMTECHRVSKESGDQFREMRGHIEALEAKLAACEKQLSKDRKLRNEAQCDADLWRFSVDMGDHPSLLVKVWKQRKALEAKLAAAEKAAFEHGYVLACCNIVNLHDEPTIAHCTLSELGVTRADVKAMNLSEYDLKALRKIERDRSRSPYAKASRKARAVLGGKP